MKLILMIGIIMLPIVSNAVDFVRTGGGDKNTVGNLINDVGITADGTYTVAPGLYGAGKVSAILAYSPKTYSNIVFSTNSYSIGSANISAIGHGMPRGLKILFTTTAGTDPAPFVNSANYYVVPISADIIQLATTSAQALTGDTILFTSKTLTGATQTYTVSAVAVAGNPVFTYSGSNDGTSYTTITSSTIVAGSVASIWAYDFSEFNYSILKLAVTSPTAGAIGAKVSVNLKP